MMETFAIRFCECNPGLFHHTDGGYVLAFATIMLNTSLHNPSVTQKPSLEEFVSMNRGIDDGKDVSRSLLEELYHSIASSPFKIPDDDDGLSLLFFNPEKEGYLRKEGADGGARGQFSLSTLSCFVIVCQGSRWCVPGGAKKTWKARWVVLKDKCLYYFKHQDDESPCGIIPLPGVRARRLDLRCGLGRDKDWRLGLVVATTLMVLANDGAAARARRQQAASSLSSSERRIAVAVQDPSRAARQTPKAWSSQVCTSYFRVYLLASLLSALFSLLLAFGFVSVRFRACLQ